MIDDVPSSREVVPQERKDEEKQPNNVSLENKIEPVPIDDVPSNVNESTIPESREEENIEPGNNENTKVTKEEKADKVEQEKVEENVNDKNEPAQELEESTDAKPSFFKISIKAIVRKIDTKIVMATWHGLSIIAAGALVRWSWFTSNDLAKYFSNRVFHKLDKYTRSIILFSILFVELDTIGYIVIIILGRKYGIPRETEIGLTIVYLISLISFTIAYGLLWLLANKNEAISVNDLVVAGISSTSIAAFSIYAIKFALTRSSLR